MDLSNLSPKSNGCGRLEQEHDPVPLNGSGVAAGSSLDSLDVFRLEPNGKWTKITKEAFFDRTVSSVCTAPIMLRHDSIYYCGNDAIWKKLSDKGDARRWIHDFLFDRIEDLKDGWLREKVSNLIAI